MCKNTFGPGTIYGGKVALENSVPSLINYFYSEGLCLDYLSIFW
jgi:hypothetical protein